MRTNFPLKLVRLSSTPLLAPGAPSSWVQDAVLNAADVYVEGQVHLTYRGADQRA